MRTPADRHRLPAWGTFGALGVLTVGMIAAGCNSPAAPVEPPSGGTTYRYDFAAFTDGIAPLIERHGCDGPGGCHGGGIRGTLELSPADAKNPQFDFEQIVLQTDGANPAASPVLRKPLDESAGGAPHAYVGFTDTDDPDYQTLLAWIAAGMPE